MIAYYNEEDIYDTSTPVSLVTGSVKKKSKFPFEFVPL